MTESIARILVVDDEESNLKVLDRLLGKAGYTVTTALSGPEALDVLRSVQPELLLTDLKMPGMDGIELLRTARTVSPTTEVIVMTAYGTVEIAVEAMKEGAYDFVTKPLNRHDILRSVGKAREKAQLLAENRRLREQVAAQTAATGSLGGMVGRSDALRSVLEVIDQVAPSEATVLINGESGTGKELLARGIHELSDRKDGPLIRVNCAAIPETLFESELFGYEKGAFTGAAGRKPGRFELADGGTLFLDEVAEMSMASQVKLLRVLQEGEFERVGGTKTVSVDVRLLAATNRDLAAMCKERTFREDLYFRLNVVRVDLPPLRERSGDLPHLVRYFAEIIGRELERSVVFTPSAVEALGTWHWPGNVRELENELRRAAALTDRPIRPSDLSSHIRS